MQVMHDVLDWDWEELDDQVLEHWRDSLRELRSLSLRWQDLRDGERDLRGYGGITDQAVQASDGRE